MQRKTNKILYMLAAICLVVIAFSLPTFAAHAAPALQETPPAVDWAEVVNKILAFSLPILVTAFFGWLAAEIRYLLAKTKAERPDIMDLLNQAAFYAAPIIEQLKKSGVIPDNSTAKLKAMQLAREWLIHKGMNAQAQEKYLDMLDMAIEGAVHALSVGTTTVTLLPVTAAGDSER